MWAKTRASGGSVSPSAISATGEGCRRRATGSVRVHVAGMGIYYERTGGRRVAGRARAPPGGGALGCCPDDPRGRGLRRDQEALRRMSHSLHPEGREESSGASTTTRTAGRASDSTSPPRYTARSGASSTTQRHGRSWNRASGVAWSGASLYGVSYAVRENQVIIPAVMHLHRRPGYWRDMAE